MTRDALVAALEKPDYAAICHWAAGDKLVLSRLFSLTYTTDDVLGWRAVKALGLAAAQVAGQDAEFVRNILRRLMWSLNDESGGIGWRSPQAMGAIIAQCPRQFAEFAPIVVSLFDLDETHFYPGVLWAIGRIAEQDRGLVQFARPRVLARLSDPDPQTRGMAAWCLGRLGDARAIQALEPLRTDPGVLSVFAGDRLCEQSVGELAQEALKQLQSEGE
jgi:HEAT repeats